jgi:hypothetical protein
MKNYDRFYGNKKNLILLIHKRLLSALNVIQPGKKKRSAIDCVNFRYLTLKQGYNCLTCMMKKHIRKKQSCGLWGRNRINFFEKFQKKRPLSPGTQEQISISVKNKVNQSS